MLRTPFVEERNRDEIEGEVKRLSGDLLGAVRQGREHELEPFTGQTAGMIREVLPAGEIVRQTVAETEETLRKASSFLR